LFLGSAGLGALPGWLASSGLTTRRAVLVPTAANRLPAAPWIDTAERLLRGEGLSVDCLDLEKADEAEVGNVMEGVDLVFVAGGHPMFLLQQVRRTGFDRVIVPAVRNGRLRYVGVSAGAALVGPDLGYFRDADEPGVVESTTGLGLVPFVVLAHRNRGRARRHDQQLAQHGTRAYISINDDQAVVVDNDNWRVIESRRIPLTENLQATCGDVVNGFQGTTQGLMSLAYAS
jgi:dipeptidase E